MITDRELFAKLEQSRRKTLARLTALPEGERGRKAALIPVLQAARPIQRIQPDLPAYEPRMGNPMHYYTLKYRPPSTFTLPPGFRMVEAPQGFGFERSPFPRSSQYRYGVVAYERPLSEDEMKQYELDYADPDPKNRRENPPKGNPYRQSESDFIWFLENTLIPDYEESGSGYAQDFKDGLYYFDHPEVTGVLGYLKYLRETIIPDSKESGYTETAKDLQRLQKMIERKLKVRWTPRRSKNPPMLVLGNPGENPKEMFEVFLRSGGEQWHSWPFHSYEEADEYAKRYQSGWRDVQHPISYRVVAYSEWGRRGAPKRSEMWGDNPASGPSDETAARELELYITNDADLYRQQFIPIVQNLMKKRAKGTFDFEKSVKLWMYLVDNGARKYIAEFVRSSTPGAPVPKIGSTFNKNTRLVVARSLAQTFVTEADLGNYDNMMRKGNPLTLAEHQELMRMSSGANRDARGWLAKGKREAYQFKSGEGSGMFQAAVEFDARNTRRYGYPEDRGRQQNPHMVIDSQGLKVLAIERGHPIQTFDRAWVKGEAFANQLGRDVHVVAHPYVPPGWKKGVQVSPMFMMMGPYQTVHPGGREKNPKPKNPWAICTTAVGRKNKKKYERCVKKVKGKMRGKNPGQLPPAIANDPKFKAELAAFHKRHGNIPVRVMPVNVPKGYPKYMSAYGEAPEAKYDAPKGSKKGKRFHIFGKKGKGRPHLVSSAEKGPKFLAYVGGNFKAKTDWLYD